MSHLIIAVDGLPEGIDILEKGLDRHCFGKGKPARLREIKLYDLQFDSKDREIVLNDFYQTLAEHTFKDGLAYRFRYKEAPFKHGKFRMAIAWIVKILGWPFGIRAVEPWKEVKAPGKQQVPKPLVNLYTIAEIPDNFQYNKAINKEEEWL
jgi:hypothetical protein